MKEKSAPKKKKIKSLRRPTVEIEKSSDASIEPLSLDNEEGEGDENMNDSKSLKSDKSGGFFEDFFSSDSDSDSSSEEDEDGPSPSEGGEPSSNETKKAIHVFTNRGSIMQDSDITSRSMVKWHHVQRFDFSNVSQEVYIIIYYIYILHLK